MPSADVMEKDHEEDKAEYSKVTDAFGQISFQTKFVNGLTELCGEGQYYKKLDLTLTRPIGLPPPAPVAQKIADQRLFGKK